MLTQSRNISFCLNELFIKLYHDRVKDMPVRAIFKQKVIDEEESDHSDENIKTDMSAEDM